MAYIQPSVRAFGELIDDDIWNQDVVANIIAIARAFLVPEHKSGHGYMPQGNVADPTGSAVAINLLYAAPIVIPNSGSYQEIDFFVHTAVASSNCRLGIYNDNGGVPGALVKDIGTVSCASTGTRTLAISPAQSLNGPSIYWLAALFSHAGISVKRLIATGFLTSDFTSGVYRALAYGALPDPFGAISDYGNPPWMAIIRS